MITVAAVQAGNYLGQGRLYVERLFAGVRRHLTVPWRGALLTDDAASAPAGIEVKILPAGLVGWWNKVALFKAGMFAPGERVFYLDLDSVIVGNLDDLAAYAGPFAIMRDVFHVEHYQSSMMSWEAGKADHVWSTWDLGGRPSFHRQGDQRWIEAMMPGANMWQDIFPGQLASFKRDCIDGKPSNARVIVFHGQPRPHDCGAEWVMKNWKGD